MTQEYDLGIHAQYLLPMANGHTDIISNGFIGIKDSKIKVVCSWSEDLERQTHKLIQATHHVVLPGLINGHSHLAMTLFRGLADDFEFSHWLYKIIFPLEAKLVEPAFLQTGTELAALELIRNGVTTVVDMYFFEHISAKVLEKSGLRALVAQGILDFPTPDDPENKGLKFRLLEELCEIYQGHERITACSGPHAPYTCSDETLKKARDIAKKRKIPLHIHVAETQSEVEQSQKQYGKTPVQRLYDLGLMSEAQCIFAHGVYLSDQDIELLAKTQTSVVYNPQSNMKLGAGVAPIPKLIKANVPLAIGTDGAASNNDLSIFGEMDTAAKLQKLIHRDNTAMTAKQALKLATWYGAHAIGLGSQIGSLEPGKYADLICVDLNHPHLQPVNDIISHLVYATKGTEVDTVICHGKVLMENGNLQTLDQDQVFHKAEGFRNKIQKTLLDGESKS